MRRDTLDLLAAAAILAAVVLASPRAIAGDLSSADQLFEQAEGAEKALELERAAHAYEQAEAHEPSGPHAAAAHARAEYLRAHGEAAFGPLVALERVRRDPRASADPTALGDLGASSKAFPPGQVRVETWVFLSLAHARLGDEARSLEFARLVLEDPAADAIARTGSANLIAETCLRSGNTTCALGAAGIRGVAPEVSAKIRRLAMRHRLVFVATGIVMSVALGSAAIIVRARARVRFDRRRTALSACAGLVIAAFGLVAASYEGASALPFVLLGGSVTGLSLLGSTLAQVVLARRALRATSFTLAIMAAAFLCLYVAGPDYLSDFGL